MKNTFTNLAWKLILPLFLLLPVAGKTEQFVKLTAEIDCDYWDNWSFFDQLGHYPGAGTSPTIFQTNHVFHCVIGTNGWLIDHEGSNARRSYWFTGTNIIEQQLAPNVAPYTMVSASIDGNPGRSGGVVDRMVMDVPARICWLAFCSGSALMRDGRQIFPPDDFWKESRLAFNGWSDKTTVFEDCLSLPKTILLVTNNQTVVQYQAHLSTNFMGWNFPSEFYLVQYIPTGSNEWKLYLTAKGRITAIEAGTKPQLPKEASKPDWIEK